MSGKGQARARGGGEGGHPSICSCLCISLQEEGVFFFLLLELTSRTTFFFRDSRAPAVRMTLLLNGVTANVSPVLLVYSSIEKNVSNTNHFDRGIGTIATALLPMCC